MTNKKYKQLSRLYKISAIVFIITFLAAIISGAMLDAFELSIGFLVFSFLALVSFSYFAWFIKWSLFNSKGREYWVIYFRRQSLKFKGNNHIFSLAPGQHPADKMKRIMLSVAIGIIIYILAITISTCYR